MLSAPRRAREAAIRRLITWYRYQMRAICVVSVLNVGIWGPFWGAMWAAAKFVYRDVCPCSRERLKDGRTQSRIYQMLTFHKLEEVSRPKLQYLVCTGIAFCLFQSFPITTHITEAVAQVEAAHGGPLRPLHPPATPPDQPTLPTKALTPRHPTNSTHKATSSLPWDLSAGRATSALHDPPATSLFRVPLSHMQGNSLQATFIFTVWNDFTDSCVVLSTQRGTKTFIFGSVEEINRCVRVIERVREHGPLLLLLPALLSRPSPSHLSLCCTVPHLAPATSVLLSSVQFRPIPLAPGKTAHPLSPDRLPSSVEFTSPGPHCR